MILYDIPESTSSETKARDIKINKVELYKDIDALTYKYADASSIPSPKIENAITSDCMEGLDSHIIMRHIEFREAKIRQLISFCLDDSFERTSANDDLHLPDTIIFNLTLDSSFKDSLLQALTTYMHRYLVWGSLYDWYAAGMGSEQARVYEKELVDLEMQIVNMLRSRATAKRPMQPFGPAKRMI